MRAEQCTSTCACQAGNMLLLIVLYAWPRLNSACWHFLSLTFPVQVPCCSWTFAVCSWVHLPQVSTSPEECHFPLLPVLCVLLCLYTSPLDPCSLSLRPLQLCPGTVLLEMPEACISPCRVTVVSLISSTHFLFAHRNRVGLDLFMVNVVYFLKRHLSSLNSVTAPCCYSKIVRSIMIGFIALIALFFNHFLEFLTTYLGFVPLKKKKNGKGWLVGIYTWASRKTCNGKLLWGGFQSISVNKAGNCSTLGDDSEAEEPALPQGGKADGWVWKWLADFYPLPAKAWSQWSYPFQLSPFSSTGPQCFWEFPGSQPLI